MDRRVDRPATPGWRNPRVLVAVALILAAALVWRFLPASGSTDLAAADVETAQDELPGEVLAPVETGAGVLEVPAPEEPEDDAGAREEDDGPNGDEPVDRNRPDDETIEPSADAGDSDEETDA